MLQGKKKIRGAIQNDLIWQESEKNNLLALKFKGRVAFIFDTDSIYVTISTMHAVAA